MKVDSLKIKVDLRGGVGHVDFAGSIDEEARYDRTNLRECSKVVFNLEGIELINSTGIQKWIAFIDALVGSVFIERCSVRIVNQLNMFPGFFGKKVVTMKSLFVPYFCESCDESKHVLVSCDQKSVEFMKSGKCPGLPNCNQCSGSLEFDGIEKKYFAFAKYENVAFDGKELLRVS